MVTEVVSDDSEFAAAVKSSEAEAAAKRKARKAKKRKPSVKARGKGKRKAAAKPAKSRKSARKAKAKVVPHGKRMEAQGRYVLVIHMSAAMQKKLDRAVAKQGKESGERCTRSSFARECVEAYV